MADKRKDPTDKPLEACEAASDIDVAELRPRSPIHSEFRVSYYEILNSLNRARYLATLAACAKLHKLRKEPREGSIGWAALETQTYVRENRQPQLTARKRGPARSRYLYRPS